MIISRTIWRSLLLTFTLNALALTSPHYSAVYAKVVQHVLRVSEQVMAPDCVDRKMMVVNGSFPGPEIHVEAGDTLDLTVINDCNEGIAMHLHGIHQKGTPFFDGAAGVAQPPIPPSSSFNMRVNIGEDEVGTHFYHAHHNFQDQSVFGPLIVHEKPSSSNSLPTTPTVPPLQYDEERIIMLSDWWHKQGNDQMAGLLSKEKFQWIGDAQSLLVNGRSVFEGRENEAEGGKCGFSTIDVTPGKTYRFRIIGSLSLGYLSFAIQDHTMTIVEVEGTRVEPFKVQSLEVNAGQRYSVLVKMDKDLTTTTTTTTGLGGKLKNEFWMQAQVRWRPTGPANG
ncbi:hypothetical protein HK102_005696, partial [Quaeritorhiza haematococci]